MNPTQTQTQKEKEIPPTPYLSDYDDYRDYFAAKFKYLKATKRHFSFAIAAKKAKVSISYFKNLFSKRRHISIEKLHLLNDLYDLSPMEQHLLIFKFLKQTSDDARIRTVFETACNAIAGEIDLSRVSTNKRVELNQKREVDSDTLLFTLMNLSQWPDYREDLAWIRAQLTDKNISDAKILAHLKVAKAEMVRLKQQDTLPEEVIFETLSTESGMHKRSVVKKMFADIHGIDDYGRLTRANEVAQYINVDEAGAKKVLDIMNSSFLAINEVEKNIDKKAIVRTLAWFQCSYRLAEKAEKGPGEK